MKSFLNKKIIFLVMVFAILISFTSCANQANQTGETKTFTSLKDFEEKGVVIGIQTGTTFDQIAKKRFPNAEIGQLSTVPDLVEALNSGLIDGFILDGPAALAMERENTSITHIEEALESQKIAFAFPKTAEGEKLNNEISAFIKKIKSDGTLDEICQTWINDERDKQITKFNDLTAKNGTLKLAIEAASVPFCFVRDNEIVGIDTDILIRFAKENGYALTPNNMNFDAVIPSLTSTCNVAGSGLSVTEERAQSVLFSEVYYDSGAVMVVKKTDAAVAAGGFNLIESFKKTFITEDRWFLILYGILNTVLISLFSAVFGTVLGFLLCLLLRLKKTVLSKIIMVFIRIMQGMPQLVFLMILFYLVFAGTGLYGEWVAVIAFSINLSAYSCMIFKTGIDSVDQGQMEAALALGSTKRMAFTRIVLPQALAQILPVYKGEIISLVKSTSIVGYIAVMDLTKVGDIIRSRTYEAFFPLIVTAIIYLIISAILTSALSSIEIKIKPKRTVKGVNLR